MAGDVTATPLCRIAVDAMGGDHAPDEIVKGALLAAEEYPEVEIILVGRADIVREKLGASTPPRIQGSMPCGQYRMTRISSAP